MDEASCRTEFGKLYPQLETNTRAWQAKGGISYDDVQGAAASSSQNWGMARVIVKDGQLFIRQVREGGESRISALLHLLHTAVSTDPASSSTRGGKVGSPVPPVDLVFTTADKDGNPSAVAWTLDKRVNEDPRIGTWLMPDFGFAGWPEAGIASYEEFIALSDREERQFPWPHKDNRAFWRGLANRYSVREDLLQRTDRRKDPTREAWADVEQTSFHDQGADFHELVPMHEHCRHKYLIHSEGNSYSGRSKYLFSCHAVVIAHPLEWTQHFHPALVSDPASTQQNYIELAGPLFNGLEQLMKGLQALDSNSTAMAGTNQPQKIADNAVQTLKQRYLTPAATMCYIRAALKAYASVLNTDTWPRDSATGESGPAPLGGGGGGVVPSGGKDKNMAAMGVKGDIEYGVWRLSGSIDWPPK